MTMYEKNYPDLLPCPFCGGKPYLERSARAFVKGQTEHVAFVRCTNCCARSGNVRLAKYGKTSHSEEAVEEAVSRWNTRKWEMEESE